VGPSRLIGPLAALATALVLVPDRPTVAATAQGSLTFEALQAGARFTGSFARFTADIAFDPANPLACRFDVGIDTASADTGEAQRDGLLKGQDFFWVEHYPAASYHGGGCRRSPSGYTLDGELTLRGVTRPVGLSFAFEPGATSARITGSATLNRLDFGVGQGEWHSTEWVGNEVVVRFDLSLPRD
jgi:polyisoprenoid-binding protein YceI